MKSILLLLTLFTLSACETPPLLKQFVVRVKETLGLETKTLPSEVKSEMSQPTPDETSNKSAGELAKANSELLFEMMSVIFNEPQVEDKSNFGELVYSLNQGASLEGIYRGIIMGSRYRALEAKSQSASPTVLKAFALEMAELQMVMKNPTEFQKDEAKKVPTIDFPEAASDSEISSHPSQVVKPKKTKDEIFQNMLETFLGASTLTLKRVLGEESLLHLDEMKDSSGDLAQWYAKFVLRMCDAGVDFGLKQRSDPNFDFHFKFAQTMALDRVKWEVLNRYHRYLM